MSAEVDGAAADIVSARRATPADLPVTAPMSDAAKDEVRDERGGRWLIELDMSRTSAAEQHLRALESPERCLVVGLINGTVVGHALAFINHAMTGAVCTIEELYVLPGGREIGVGSAILEEMTAWAVDMKCLALESQVLPGNRSAKNFFERVGMVTRRMVVSTQLSAG